MLGKAFLAEFNNEPTQRWSFQDAEIINSVNGETICMEVYRQRSGHLRSFICLLFLKNNCFAQIISCSIGYCYLLSLFFSFRNGNQRNTLSFSDPSNAFFGLTQRPLKAVNLSPINQRWKLCSTQERKKHFGLPPN